MNLSTAWTTFSRRRISSSIHARERVGVGVGFSHRLALLHPWRTAATAAVAFLFQKPLLHTSHPSRKPPMRCATSCWPIVADGVAR